MAKLSFEKAMQKLEQIVHELESRDQPLEKALKKFEEGIKLSKRCSEMLEETEKRITILLQDQEGHLLEEPFTSDDESTDD